MRQIISITLLSLVFLPTISLATDVGGIIWTDTTWDLARSPFMITKEVQTAEGVTLNIEPGVVVNTPGYTGGAGIGATISIWGTLRAVETEISKIVFNGVYLYCFSPDTSILSVQYAQYNGGQIYIDAKTATIKNSKFEDTAWFWINLNIENASTYIEENIFVRTGSIRNFPRTNGIISIRNNAIYDQIGFDGEGAISIADCQYQDSVAIKYNSFLSNSKIAVSFISVSHESQVKKIDLTNNYWNTDNSTTIDSMILDRNDNLGCFTYVSQRPPA